MRTQPARLLWIGLVLLAAVACQRAAPADRARETEAATAVSPRATAAAPAASAADSAGEPVRLNAKAPPDVRLEWFSQDAGEPKMVYYYVTVTGRETSQAQVDSTLRVRAYDAGGQLLGEDRLLLGWILPGQSLHTAAALYVESGARVDRLEVTAGEPGQTAALPNDTDGSLSAEEVGFTTMDRTSYAIGAIRNTSGKTLMGVDVTAVAYDAGGRVQDAATERLRFILAGQQVAVQVELHSSRPPARVELHPHLSSSVQFLGAQASPIGVKEVGALRVFPGTVEAAFVLENHAARGYAPVYFHVSLYGDRGQAVAARDGEFGFIFPNGTSAHTVRLFYDRSIPVARVDVHVRPSTDKWGDSQAAAEAGAVQIPIAVESALYWPSVDHGSDKVTALISNASSQSIDSAGATALLYDAAGQIVGSGDTSLGVLPAGGQMQAEIDVQVMADVDHVEVVPFFYRMPAGLSESAAAPPAQPAAQPAAPSGGQASGPETPSPGVQAPELLGTWFTQNSSNEDVFDYALLLANPNPALDLHGIEYQVVAYDSAGLAVASGTAWLDWLPAGGRLGVVNSLVRDSGTPARIEATIAGPGQPQAPAGAQPPLRAGQAAFASYGDWSSVSGAIGNALDQPVAGVRVNALVFDASDQIVGAGAGHDDYFISAGGQAPVAVKVVATGAPVRAELYPFFVPMGGGPHAAGSLQPLKVIAAGFAQLPDNPGSVVAAFVVENPNPGQAIFDAAYQLAAYDSAGALLRTTAGDRDPLPVVYPGGRTAVVTRFDVPAQAQVAVVDVMCDQGQAQAVTDRNPLVGDKAAYIAKPYPKVTGLVLNSSGKEIKRVNVYAVLYDSAGRIIGGGNAQVDSAPANGQVPVEMMVYSTGAPDRMEIYAGPAELD